jgi:hypothetical protein
MRRRWSHLTSNSSCRTRAKTVIPIWGFGDGKRAFFWIKQGKPDPAAIHWGFVAENNVKVDEFYKAAMSAGARDNISPRARLEYYPGYYAADIFDPDGYSFEVVHKS